MKKYNLKKLKTLKKIIKKRNFMNRIKIQYKKVFTNNKETIQNELNEF